MKINVEIDLDWISEENSIDEVVKQEIINGVTNKIHAGIESQVEAKIKNEIDSVIVKKINDRTDAMFTDFINRPVTLTDGYGSKLKVYDNVESIVKERFDKFMTEMVDDQGRVSNYGSKFTRLDYIISNQLNKMAKEFTDKAVKTVSEEIKSHIKEGLTTKLGQELMNVLKVNEMLALPAKQ